MRNASDTVTTTAPVLSGSQSRRFAEDGFVAVPDLISRGEALAARQVALDLAERPPSGLIVPNNDGIFHQLINVWRIHPVLRGLTLHPRLLEAVRELSEGRPMRLWHDQLFIKRPEDSLATEFHQDLPYWPVPHETFTISAWFALGDIPQDHGCLTFIPGSHRLRGPASDLRRADSLMELHPSLVFDERVSLPLPAGGCTLHQGYAAHRACPNLGPDARVALSVIFMPESTVCCGAWHVLTSSLGLRDGAPFPDEFCPALSTLASP